MSGKPANRMHDDAIPIGLLKYLKQQNKVTFYNYNSKSVIENSFQFFFFYLEVILSNGVYLTASGCVTDSVEKFVRTLNERKKYNLKFVLLHVSNSPLLLRVKKKEGFEKYNMIYVKLYFYWLHLHHFYANEVLYSMKPFFNLR